MRTQETNRKAETMKTTAITIVVGTHGNTGFGWTRTTAADGRIEDTRPRRLAEIKLPAWTKAATMVPHGYNVSSYGVATEFVRA